MNYVAAIAALLLPCASAFAGFISANYSVPGNDPQQTFSRAMAGGNEQIVYPTAFPFSVVQSDALEGTFPYARIEQTFSLSTDVLKVDVTKMERGGGPTSVLSQGAMVFEVKHNMRSLAGASLQTFGRADYALWVWLIDFTTEQSLFLSSQYDFGENKEYLLGGLIGNQIASFSGSLENELLAGHTYRLSYLLYAQGSDGYNSPPSTSFAQVSISAVPEPATYALMLVGLGVMGMVVRRRNNNQA